VDYASNGTNICGASCGVTGGWLTYTVYLSEGSGCVYEGTIYAYTPVGNYEPHVYCYKYEYDSQTEYFNIDVTMKSSSLSISLSNTNPYPGDYVTVYAYYEDGDGYNIYDGWCTAELREDGDYVSETSLTSYGSSYYSGSVYIPERYGSYDIKVPCSSDQHDTKSSTESFATAKKYATLSLSTSPYTYHGESFDVVAYYKDSMGTKISGTCSLSFDGKESIMSSTASGYEMLIEMPYKTGYQSINVSCESDAYEALENSRTISGRDRSTEMKIILPSRGMVFYPNERIELEVSYKDTLSGQDISNAKCAAEIGGRSYPLIGYERYYAGKAENQSIGEHELKFTCSKIFFQAKAGGTKIVVMRIPINIILSPNKHEFRKDEKIEINAMVVDKNNNEVDANCKARADVYDLSLDRLTDSHDIEERRMGDGARVLHIPNPGNPSRIRVTMTCSGDIFEEKSVYTDVKIKILGKEIEEGMLLFLTVVTVCLVGLTFLIRNKLKII